MKLGGENAAADSSASRPGGSDKSMPKDGRVMMAILKDMNIMDYEPRVVNQLLEFSYRYISTILEDSRVLSNHARKKALDVDDVKMAVQMYAEHNLTSPPSRDVLLDVAAKKNAIPLPIPKTSGGLHLPPDRYCLAACNYRLKAQKKKPGARGGGGSTGYSVGGGGRNSYASRTKAMPSPTGVMFQAMNSGSKNPSIKLNSGGGGMSMGGAISKIQVQPQGDGQPMFSMTVNPSAVAGGEQPGGGVGMKRKADQLDQQN